MCFRPAEAAAEKPKCPGCGKPVIMMGKVPPKACAFCKFDFEEYMKNGGGAPSAPAAPAAPAAPGAPAAPKAPSA